jgi:hypothetical protein
VIQLADALGFKRFPIVGGSGGVPATLGCAYKIADRLSAVGLLFGPRPLDFPGATDGWSRARRFQVFLEQHGPFWVTRMAMSIVARMMFNDPEKALAKIFEELPPADREVMDNPSVRRQYIDTIPNCRAEFIADEGHFSLLPNHAQEILDVLVR